MSVEIQSQEQAEESLKKIKFDIQDLREVQQERVMWYAENMFSMQIVDKFTSAYVKMFTTLHLTKGAFETWTHLIYATSGIEQLRASPVWFYQFSTLN